MVYTRSSDYLYRRNGIYYFTRSVPSDLQTRFNKSRVVVSLDTRSIVKAQKSALALCDRLDRYFESLRVERFHSQELGLKFNGVHHNEYDCTNCVLVTRALAKILSKYLASNLVAVPERLESPTF